MSQEINTQDHGPSQQERVEQVLQTNEEVELEEAAPDLQEDEEDRIEEADLIVDDDDSQEEILKPEDDSDTIEEGVKSDQGDASVTDEEVEYQDDEEFSDHSDVIATKEPEITNQQLSSMPLLHMSNYDKAIMLLNALTTCDSAAINSLQEWVEDPCEAKELVVSMIEILSSPETSTGTKNAVSIYLRDYLAKIERWPELEQCVKDKCSLVAVGFICQCVPCDHLGEAEFILLGLAGCLHKKLSSADINQAALATLLLALRTLHSEDSNTLSDVISSVLWLCSDTNDDNASYICHVIYECCKGLHGITEQQSESVLGALLQILQHNTSVAEEAWRVIADVVQFSGVKCMNMLPYLIPLLLQHMADRSSDYPCASALETVSYLCRGLGNQLQPNFSAIIGILLEHLSDLNTSVTVRFHVIGAIGELALCGPGICDFSEELINSLARESDLAAKILAQKDRLKIRENLCGAFASMALHIHDYGFPGEISIVVSAIVKFVLTSFQDARSLPSLGDAIALLLGDLKNLPHIKGRSLNLTLF